MVYKLNVPKKQASTTARETGQRLNALAALAKDRSGPSMHVKLFTNICQCSSMESKTCWLLWVISCAHTPTQEDTHAYKCVNI